MDAAIASTLDFVAAHGDWAILIALVFAAAETTAFLSILIPSTAILMGVGALAATGAVDLFPIWVGASIGALIGSTFSWWLGWRYGEHFLRVRPLKDHPEMVARASATFAKWGVFGIIIGHFVGPLRPVVFLMAGTARMRFVRFQAFNTVGGLSWAFAMPMSGMLGGDLIGWLWQFLPF